MQQDRNPQIIMKVSCKDSKTENAARQESSEHYERYLPTNATEEESSCSKKE
jgi:hypothetical protein